MSYKVIQWATGAMGKACLRVVIDHQDMEIAGLYVYSDSKVGLDAGEIVKRNTTGVTATNSIDDILGLDADVVIHAARLQPPYAHHNKDICRILASGKNVISINGHVYPQYWGEAYLKQITEACQKGGTTLFGTGLNPGFITEKIATIATGLCNRIDSIFISEVLECNVIRDPNYAFDILGFGADCGSINPNDPSWAPAEILNSMYSEVVALLVNRLGFCLDRVESDHIMLPATKDINIPAGFIKKGTIGHTNWRWHGIVNNQRMVTMSIFWIMETTHLDTPDYNLWNIKIKGLPGVSIAIDLNNPEDYPYKTSPEQLAVAASVVNSIPAVCAADPGILQIPIANHFRKCFKEPL